MSTTSIIKKFPSRSDFTVAGYYKELQAAICDDTLDQMYDQRSRMLTELGALPTSETKIVGGYERHGYGLNTAQLKAAEKNLWIAYGDRQNDFDNKDLLVTQRRVERSVADFDSQAALSLEAQLARALRAAD